MAPYFIFLLFTKTYRCVHNHYIQKHTHTNTHLNACILMIKEKKTTDKRRMQMQKEKVPFLHCCC